MRSVCAQEDGLDDGRAEMSEAAAAVSSSSSAHRATLHVYGSPRPTLATLVTILATLVTIKTPAGCQNLTADRTGRQKNALGLYYPPFPGDITPVLIPYRYTCR